MSNLNKNKNYWRVHKLIIDAYLQLSLNQDPNAYTIDAICKKAKVSRPSFYTHFKNIDGVKKDIEEMFRNELEKLLDSIFTSDVNKAVKNPFGFAKQLTNPTKKVIKLYRWIATVGNSYKIVNEASSSYIDKNYDNINFLNKLEAETSKYIVRTAMLDVVNYFAGNLQISKEDLRYTLCFMYWATGLAPYGFFKDLTYKDFFEKKIPLDKQKNA